MTNRLALVLAFLAICSVCAAASETATADSARAETEDEASLPSLREVISQNREQGYIIPLAGIGNMNPLVFEAKVSPYYALRLGERSAAVVFAFKAIFRMSDEGSIPVRTPSYMPRLIYYNYGEKHDDGTYDYYYIMLSHHSNGAEGEFYQRDGRVNRIDGNFSTDFVELGVHRGARARDRRGGAAVPRLFRGGAAVQIHLPLTRSEALEEVDYGFYRVKYWDSIPWNGGEVCFSAFAILGPLHEAETFDWKRLGVDISLRQDLGWFDGFDLFLNYYAGQDYYNIWYTRNLSVLRLGIIADVGL